MIEKIPVEILLVEDTQFDVFLILEKLDLLPHYEHITTLVKTFKRAKEQLKKRTFDLVILDLGLPDSKGLNTIRGIQAIFSKILIFTGATIEDDLLLKQGIKGFMPKSDITKPKSELQLEKEINFALASDELKEGRETLRAVTANLEKALDNCAKMTQKRC